MPFAAKVPCKGCHRPVESGYCAACKAQGRGREPRPNSAQRGYGSRWQKTSAAYLRAHPIAVDWFGEHGQRVFAAQVVDHIVPHKGDMKLFWDPENWQGLTKRDHDRKTALENSGLGLWVNAGTAEAPAMRWQRMG
jgi:5-methylcytosine-specific restriction protein A